MIIKPKTSFIAAIPIDSSLRNHITWGGWGNGYVAVMPDHPLYEVDYNDVNVDVHGGLTYSGYADNLRGFDNQMPPKSWVFGFDTLHTGDDMTQWPDKASVLAEAKRLQEQIDNYSKTII